MVSGVTVLQLSWTNRRQIPVAKDERQYKLRNQEAPPVRFPVAGTEICSYHTLSDLEEGTPYHIVEATQSCGKSGANSACAENDNPNSALICHHSTIISCPIIQEWEHLDGQLLPFKIGATENCQQMWEKCNGDLVGGSIKPKNDEGIAMNTVRVVYLRHYYNPDFIEGLVDTGSFFELTYTPDLRPFIATQFFLQSTSLHVPAHTMNHKVGVIFPKECTMDMDPFTIVSASAHMHDRSSDAREMIVHHIRDGQELKPLLHVQNFVERTESESKRPLKVEILPGDEIILECFYDNDSDMDEVFGSSWWNQMCVVTFDTKSRGSMKYFNGNEEGWDGSLLGGDNDPSIATCGGKSGGGRNVFLTGVQRAQRFNYKPYTVQHSKCGSSNPNDGDKDDYCASYSMKNQCKFKSRGHCVWKSGKCKPLCDAITKFGCRNSKAKRARCAWNASNGTCGTICGGASFEGQCTSFKYRVKGRCEWKEDKCQPKTKT